jgi:nicotinate-nucleotide adenylyltransferase
VKIGLLGGTFDPIHLGHLRAAENARAGLGLERVVFVPARVPPHRPPPRTGAFDRFAMVALATAGHGAFVASDLELLREGPSYTIDTVRALQRSLTAAADVFLIVGSDTYGEVSGWKDASELLRLCSLAVVPRPGAAGGKRAEPPEIPRGAVFEVDGSGLPISASAVRERAAARRSVDEWVPPVVAEYIQKRELYR